MWYNSDVVRLRNKVGKSAFNLTGFKYMLGLSLYWWWALILSLRSGDGLYEGLPYSSVRRGVHTMAESIQCNTWVTNRIVYLFSFYLSLPIYNCCHNTDNNSYTDVRYIIKLDMCARY